jgi:hypothetical protein
MAIYSKATDRTVQSHSKLVHTIVESTKIRYNGYAKAVKREGIKGENVIIKAVNRDFLSATQIALFPPKSKEHEGVVVPTKFVSAMVLDTAYVVSLELSLDYVAVSTGAFTETVDANGTAQKTETMDYKYQLRFKDITFFAGAMEEKAASIFSVNMFADVEY